MGKSGFDVALIMLLLQSFDPTRGHRAWPYPPMLCCKSYCVINCKDREVTSLNCDFMITDIEIMPCMMSTTLLETTSRSPRALKPDRRRSWEKYQDQDTYGWPR